MEILKKTFEKKSHEFRRLVQKAYIGMHRRAALPRDTKSPYYNECVDLAIEKGQVSTSMIQRHLKIGYNRAARLVEDMEKAGLVSSMSTSGQREILVPSRAE